MLLGIDLGTSSVKAVVTDDRGQILGVGAHEYPILVPRTGYAEQSPHDWWQATQSAVRQALSQVVRPAIQGIGLCGQMHGFVFVDPAGQPLGNAIIWPDQRSADAVSWITERIGVERLA